LHSSDIGGHFYEIPLFTTLKNRKKIVHNKKNGGKMRNNNCSIPVFRHAPFLPVLPVIRAAIGKPGGTGEGNFYGKKWPVPRQSFSGIPAFHEINDALHHPPDNKDEIIPENAGVMGC
jgi:hypothetical protein